MAGPGRKSCPPQPSMFDPFPHRGILPHSLGPGPDSSELAHDTKAAISSNIPPTDFLAGRPPLQSELWDRMEEVKNRDMITTSSTGTLRIGVYVTPHRRRQQQLAVPKSQPTPYPDTTSQQDVLMEQESPPPPDPPAQQEQGQLSGGGMTFLKLPLEIRTQIYKELPDTLILSRPLIYCVSLTKPRQHCLASVCKQVREEALAIFYGYNTWCIKLEHRMMYEAFKSWIASVGDENACNLRLLHVSVRSQLFRRVPRPPVQPPTNYPVQPPEIDIKHTLDYGEAAFKIDLSERFDGGQVTVLRNEGDPHNGESARVVLAGIVARLWKRRTGGAMTSRDIVEAMEEFLGYTGWWL